MNPIFAMFAALLTLSVNCYLRFGIVEGCCSTAIFGEAFPSQVHNVTECVLLPELHKLHLFSAMFELALQACLMGCAMLTWEWTRPNCGGDSFTPNDPLNVTFLLVLANTASIYSLIKCTMYHNAILSQSSSKNSSKMSIINRITIHSSNHVSLRIALWTAVQMSDHLPFP